MVRPGASVGISIVVAALAACAPPPPHARRPALGALDQDRDGRVSHEEFVAFMEGAGFARIDTDHSGALTWDEWRVFDTTPEARRNFEALDTDRDQAITPAEWTYNFGRSGVGLRLFTHFDADRDEALSEREIDASPVAPLLTIPFR